MSEEFVERRSEARRRGLLRGSVVFAGGKSSMDCTVRNITSKGAKLEFGDNAVVPSQFELRLLDRGRKMTAQKVWVRGKEMGTSFE